MTGLYGLELRAVTAALNASVLPDRGAHRGARRARRGRGAGIARAGDGDARRRWRHRPRRPAARAGAGALLGPGGVGGRGAAPRAAGGGDRARGGRHLHQRRRRARRPPGAVLRAGGEPRHRRAGPRRARHRRGRRLDAAGPQGPALRRRARAAPTSRACPYCLLPPARAARRRRAPSSSRRGPTTRPTTWCCASPTAARPPSPTPAPPSPSASSSPATTPPWAPTPTPPAPRSRWPARCSGSTATTLAERMLRTSAEAVGALAMRVAEEFDLARPTIVAVGGGAGGLGRYAASVLGLECLVPELAEVISAVGDALSLVRVERERSVPPGQVVDGAELAAEAEAACIAAGADPASVDVRVELDADGITLRAIATGMVGLEAGALPGRARRSPRPRPPRSWPRSGAGAPRAVGRFWVASGPGRRAGLPPPSCSTASATRSPPGPARCSGSTPPTPDAGRSAMPAPTLVARVHAPARARSTIDPTVWVVQGNRAIQVAPTQLAPACQDLRPDRGPGRRRAPGLTSPTPRSRHGHLRPPEHAPPPAGRSSWSSGSSWAWSPASSSAGPPRPGMDDAVADVQEQAEDAAVALQRIPIEYEQAVAGSGGRVDPHDHRGHRPRPGPARRGLGGRHLVRAGRPAAGRRGPRRARPAAVEDQVSPAEFQAAVDDAVGAIEEAFGISVGEGTERRPVRFATGRTLGRDVANVPAAVEGAEFAHSALDVLDCECIHKRRSRDRHEGHEVRNNGVRSLRQA